MTQPDGNNLTLSSTVPTDWDGTSAIEVTVPAYVQGTYNVVAEYQNPNGDSSQNSNNAVFNYTEDNGIGGPGPVGPEPYDINDPNADGNALTSSVSGDEDTSIALNLGPITPLDPNETISDVTISGVPSGATLSAGTDNGDGSWTVAVSDVPGLTLTPVSNDSTDISLTTSVTFSEGSVSQAFVGTTDIEISAVADDFDFSVSLSDGNVTLDDDTSSIDVSLQNRMISNTQTTSDRVFAQPSAEGKLRSAGIY